MTTIEVELLGQGTWEALVEFRVVLKTDSVMGCSVSRQLGEARVKVIGSDTFPCTDLKDQIVEGRSGIDEIPKLTLFSKFIQWNLSDPAIRKGSIKRALEDQLHNVSFIIKQFIAVYLINRVLDKDAKSSNLFLVKDKQQTLLALVVVETLLLLILHIGDYQRLTWPQGGPLRKKIQKALLRRFMYYSEPSRMEVKEGELTMAMTRESIALSTAHSKTMKLLQALGGLLMILGFKLFAPMVFGKKIVWSGLTPVFIFPILLGGFMSLRTKITSRSFEEKNSQQDGIVVFVDEAIRNYPLISDYSRRQDFVEHIETNINGWNKANRELNMVLLNNKYFLPWVTQMMVAAWMLFAGSMVIMGRTSLGMFLADIAIIKKLGDVFGDLYGLAMDLQMMIPEVERIVLLLNKETFLDDKMVIEKSAFEETKMLRDKLRSKFEGSCLDHEPLMVEDLKFELNSGFGGQSLKMSMAGKMEIEQGTLSCLVGRHGHGKSTMLRLLAGNVVPSNIEGHLFVPSHLRVLHISMEPLFFEGTLLHNLTFGVKVPQDGDLNRIKAILHRLSLTDDVDLNSEDTDNWQRTLHMTAQYKLHLARALIGNPYLLCVHKPAVVYNQTNTKVVMDILRDFVTSRGVEQDEATFSQRRPRTCVYTSSRPESAAFADKVFQVSTSGIAEVRKEDIVDAMFS